MGKRIKYEDFILAARKVHGNKYIYTKEGFENRLITGKIRYTCPKHGDVEQKMHSHLSGSGCNLCGNEKISKKSKRTFEDFLKRAVEVHGDKYIYDENSYECNTKKVRIYCKIHDLWFEQLPCNHFKGCGCPKCGKNYRMSTDEFISTIKKRRKSNNILFDKVVYVNNHTPVTITCKIHGDFDILPSSLTDFIECPECQKERLHNSYSKTTRQFIEEAKKIHGDKYDYSKTSYKTCHDKVLITCKEHGDFYQLPNVHLRGSGCPKCGSIKAWDKRNDRINTEKFISRSVEKHGNIYDYSKTIYLTKDNHVTITCPKHGEFKQLPHAHLNGQGCPICSSEKSDSIGEIDLRNYIRSLYDGKIISNSRSVIKPLELDSYLPDCKIAFEYNGLYWHCEFKQNNDYHIVKTKACEEKGIQLIHVFEDEWQNKQDIVKSRIKSILGKQNRRIYARKCSIKEIDSNVLKMFLEENHLQGNINSKYRYGLFYKDELVTVMSFGGLRKSLGSKSTDDEYELLRYCSKLNTSVVGGASKLLKHFINEIKPKRIISYADRRWSDGGMYFKLGFKHIRNSKPNYYYIVENKRENRFKYRKDQLVKQGFDPNKSEHEIMLERGIPRIYDCGCMVFEMKL